MTLPTNIALVIGGFCSGDERSVQCSGIADEPNGEELFRIKSVYFSSFPDGREREHWDGIKYVRVRPTWMRYGDYAEWPPAIFDFQFSDE